MHFSHAEGMHGYNGAYCSLGCWDTFMASGVYRVLQGFMGDKTMQGVMHDNTEALTCKKEL